ncbi:MAG TPA: hypothetical protein VN761_09510 [Candidatus Polarisedimenticolia bacterium]|nr:hypothetical protein [Candidatus Polarisedimenticolia bacterium]
MLNQRQRFLVWAVAAIAGIWVVAWVGQLYLEHLKVTAEKVRAYLDSTDFAHLTGDARAKALKELEKKLNALSFEERQRLRAERLIDKWFADMTEDEKTQFVEATMPTGIKQMLNAFEQMPEDKRHRMIDDTLKQLQREDQRAATNGIAGRKGTNGPPISPELEAKIRTIGLNSFYSQSSAATKAELAPVLEQLQKTMESGRNLRRQ